MATGRPPPIQSSMPPYRHRHRDGILGRRTTDLHDHRHRLGDSSPEARTYVLTERRSCSRAPSSDFTIWQLMVMCARAASEAFQFHQSYIHQPIVAGEAKGRETNRDTASQRLYAPTGRNVGETGQWPCLMLPALVRSSSLDGRPNGEGLARGLRMVRLEDISGNTRGRAAASIQRTRGARENGNGSGG